MKDKILSTLENGGEYVSGEELSKNLGVCRTAVWKNIKALRDEGYIISSSTKRGYRLEGVPDILNKQLICGGLDVSSAGTDMLILKTVDSTNDEAKRMAANGAPSGLIIAAENQTGGKGRLGRSWCSDSGGLYFTLLLRPELPPADIAGITLSAGYAVCLAIREYTGLDALIKWPNDVIIGNRKVCGILTEMAAQSDRIDYVVIGIGINVNHSEFPGEIKNKATSLFIETGERIDRNKLFRLVIEKLDKVLGSFLFSLSAEDMEGFKDLCATMGRRVTLERSGVTISGEAVDITSSGELVIKDDNGKEYNINSGEVSVQGIY